MAGDLASFGFHDLRNRDLRHHWASAANAEATFHADSSQCTKRPTREPLRPGKNAKLSCLMVRASNTRKACAPTCGLKLLCKCHHPAVVVGKFQKLTPLPDLEY